MKLHRLWKCSNSPEIYRRFSELRADLKTRIESSYCDYIKYIEVNIKANPRGFWRHVSSLRTKGGFEPSVTFEGQTFSGVAAADAFANFFSSTFLPDVPVLDTDEAYGFARTLPDVCEGSALAALVASYCPGALERGAVRAARPRASLHDCLHNLLLVRDFCRDHLPYDCFHMPPEDVAYMRGMKMLFCTKIIEDVGAHLFQLDAAEPGSDAGRPFQHAGGAPREGGAESGERLVLYVYYDVFLAGRQLPLIKIIKITTFIFCFLFNIVTICSTQASVGAVTYTFIILMIVKMNNLFTNIIIIPIGAPVALIIRLNMIINYLIYRFLKKLLIGLFVLLFVFQKHELLLKRCDTRSEREIERSSEERERRKSMSMVTSPAVTTWQQHFEQHDQHINGGQLPAELDAEGGGGDTGGAGGGAMSAQLNNIRLKLEEKRRRIELDKRRLEAAVSRQRQQLGHQAFLQAVTRHSQFSSQQDVSRAGASLFGSTPQLPQLPHFEPAYRHIEPERRTFYLHESPPPAPAPQRRTWAQHADLRGWQEREVLQGMGRLHISSGTRTYRIPSPTRPALFRRDELARPAHSEPARPAHSELARPAHPEPAEPEKGFYISFEEPPRRAKPPLRSTRGSPRKEPASPPPAPDHVWARPHRNMVAESSPERCVSPARDPHEHEPQRDAIARQTQRVTNAEPAALLIGEGEPDPNSAEEMERKKERIMLLSLQRRQRAEEARARSEAAAAARRQRDEAAAEGKVINKTDLESLREGAAVLSGGGAAGGAGAARVRGKAGRARPKTIHVDSDALHAADTLRRQPSATNLAERVSDEPQTTRGRSKYSTYQNNFKAGRKSSSLMNLCAGGRCAGPRLYKQPATKSNRGIMLNAVEYCVFPGAVNADAKRRVLEEIARSESKHFLVLFRDAGCQFRALYAYCPEAELVAKLYGTGPRSVTDRMFDKFFKYNSGSKCFSQIHTKHLTVTIDAFTIHNSLWQGKKVQLPSKKDMALVI
ncbi:unnamed protein product [Leptidea sinapis]|uniref:CKK domain-containing protein n=1 Tax=Leptidea sinapis TaxID=189913 RepID=A0A5E4QWD0_9NEOP|nr:unnamed protein product [Leptidea sinapis]